jgi:hypothetical protein
MLIYNSKIIEESKNQTKMNFIHTYDIFSFLVLILKVVMYYEPSLVVMLKNSKCICMSYMIINPWLSWIEICEYFDEFTFVHIC